MRHRVVRFYSCLVVGTLALGLALNGPAHASNPGQPGGKACMSDNQLRAFMADVMLQSLTAQATVCRKKAPELADQLQTSFDGYSQKIKAIGDKTMADVVEIFRPEYGDEAPATRMAAIDAAIGEAVAYMESSWTAENCGYFVQNLDMLSKEINGLDLGPTITGMIDQGFGAERGLIRRC